MGIFRRHQPWDWAKPKDMESLVRRAYELTELPNVTRQTNKESGRVSWDISMLGNKRVVVVHDPAWHVDRMDLGLILMTNNEIKQPDVLQQRLAVDIMQVQTFGTPYGKAESVTALQAMQSVAEIDPDMLPVIRMGGTILSFEGKQAYEKQFLAYEPLGRAGVKLARAEMHAEPLNIRRQDVVHWMHDMDLYTEHVLGQRD